MNASMVCILQGGVLSLPRAALSSRNFPKYDELQASLGMSFKGTQKNCTAVGEVRP